MIYPDLGCVLSLLTEGDHTTEASQLLRGIQQPLHLSLFHKLQVENTLLRFFHSTEEQSSELARQALLLWREHLHEGVFALTGFNLDWACTQAAVWNMDYPNQPPRWSLLLHPAVALSVQADFLSFDPALRKLAKSAGLRLLPESL